jgi:hypothetical protein
VIVRTIPSKRRTITDVPPNESSIRRASLISTDDTYALGNFEGEGQQRLVEGQGSDSVAVRLGGTIRLFCRAPAGQALRNHSNIC